eukprot:g6586.t1
MESAGRKRSREGVDGDDAGGGVAALKSGGERRRRRNRFATADEAPPPPTQQTLPGDDMADLGRILAEAKAKAVRAAQSAQQQTATATAAGVTHRAAAGTNGNAAAAAATNGGAAAAAVAAATARVQALAGGGLGMGTNGGVAGPAATAAAAAARAKAAEMAMLEAQIRASISNATSMFAAAPPTVPPAVAAGVAAAATNGIGNNGTASVLPKKAKDHTLRLDDKGRQVDADGKVVRMGPVLTAKANRLGNKAHNPYLQHKTVEETDAAQVVDPRVQTGNRDKRAKRAFNFVEEGTFVKQGDNLRFREHRKLLSGRNSGRNRAEQLDAPGDDGNRAGTSSLSAYSAQPEVNEAEVAAAAAAAAAAKEAENAVPPLREAGQDLVEMEWWDEAFLTKEMRDDKAAGKLEGDAGSTEALYALLKLENAKTFKYVQHPKKPVEAAAGAAAAGGGAAGQGAGAADGDGGAAVAMKVYLTKKERKRIRRTTRMEREREKQDKIALGLIPAPPPKMSMTNFMQVLGDQAVVDPSKVEELVKGQVQRRKAQHEARNQAAKLTPQEKKDKKKKKLLEDTSKELQVAVFRVADMSDPKRRFKVDVNAQQRYLTGGVVMCTDAANPGMNMVVVEGGPKAVRAYVKLMTRRIRWGGGDYGEGDSDSDSDEEIAKPALSGNMCELVWQGTVQARSFPAFRFQECKSPDTARKVLDEKGVAHLWDMVVASAKAAKASAANATGVLDAGRY